MTQNMSWIDQIINLQEHWECILALPQRIYHSEQRFQGTAAEQSCVCDN